MTFKGPEQVKAVGRKIDGAELVESSAIAARYQERYDRRRCNRLKIARTGQQDHLSSGAASVR